MKLYGARLAAVVLPGLAVDIKSNDTTVPSLLKPDDGNFCWLSWNKCNAVANCLSFTEHEARRAASRAAWIAGNNRAINTPMMAITTSNSTRVNPRFTQGFFISH